jgi:8-oxo-dGTP pyrophosphatase MutT (NUDIX family)
MRNYFERFIIGQKAALIRDERCLIVETSAYPGLWELPGGRINKGELREAALKREIKEELGIKRFDLRGVADYEIWYHHKDTNTPFCATVHLIKNDTSEIVLSSESLQYKWITENEIGEYDYFWKVSPRFIKNSFKLYRMLLKNDEK